ncbi:MAG: hypothetical protein RLY77_1593 [Pseudomonadota bacterium]|jgi:catechol 2,3-dioxygenase-like lactoylglutathione lyase family enzyme
MTTIPFNVQRLDHVVLRVSDLDRAEAFYRDVVGSEVVRRRDDLGLRHLRAGTSMIDLIAVDGKLGQHGGTAAGDEGRNVDHLCLRIEPFDEAAIVRHLAKFGLAPHGPATSNFGAEGDGPSLYITDSDGNTIELKGPST